MSGSLPTNRHAAAVLALLAGVLFFEILFQGRVLFERDVASLVYVQAETFVRTVASGAWPVWDPWTAFGQPTFANPGAQVLYPWTWLNLLAPPGTAYTVYVVGHFLLSGLGLHLLARRLGLSPGGALLAACLWVLSGPHLSLVNLWQHFAGAAWIPWVLLAARAAAEAPSPPRALAWGAAAAGQALAGSVEMCAATAVLAGGLVAGGLLRSRSRAEMRALITTGLLAAVIAAGLAAALWVPAIALLREAARAEMPSHLRSYWSLHPLGLLQCLLPVIPRDLPLLPEMRGRLFEDREPFLSSLYLGLASLPFVAAGAATAGRRVLSRALLVLVAAGMLLALGRHGVLYDVAVAVAPPLGIFRYPVKAMVPAALAWALLAGLGFDVLRPPGVPRRPSLRLAAAPTVALASAVLVLGLLLLSQPALFAERFLPVDGKGLTWGAAAAQAGRSCLVAGGLALAAAVALARARRLPRAVGVAGLLAVADPAAVHRPLNPAAPRLLLSAPPILGPLVADGVSRLYSFDYLHPIPGKVLRRPAVHLPLPPHQGDLPPLLWMTLAQRGALPPPTAQAYGVAGSFDWDVLSLAARPLHDLNQLLRAAEETPAFPRLLRLGAVSHVVALHEEGLEDLARIATVGGPAAGGSIHAFRVRDPLPRVFAVGDAVFADGTQALAQLVDPRFDPSRRVVLPRSAGPSSTAGTGGAFVARTTVRSFRADRVVVDLELSDPGFLVQVDAWDAGWRAWVDGREAPVERGNVAFRAVPVPAGRHRVELVYRPRSVPAGLLVSAMTAAAIAGAALLGRFRR